VDLTWIENPSVHAAEYVVKTPASGAGEDIAQAVGAILADLALALKQEGCLLIGHIKALAQGVPAGHLYASLISLEQGVSMRGELPPNLVEARLTLNLIVYGVEKARLPELTDRCVLGRLQGATRMTATEQTDRSGPVP